MSSFTLAFVGLLSASSLSLAASESFIEAATVEQRFHQEVRGYAGKGVLNQELPAIRKALEPMWIDLPKNDEGKLVGEQVYTAVGDALLKRHDIVLETEQAANQDGQVSKKELSSFLMTMFEEIFGQEGLMLHEVTLFAATLEGLLLDEKLWQEVAAPVDDLALPAEGEGMSSGLIATLLVAGILMAGADAARRFGGVSVYKGKIHVQ